MSDRVKITKPDDLKDGDLVKATVTYTGRYVAAAPIPYLRGDNEGGMGGIPFAVYGAAYPKGTEIVLDRAVEEFKDGDVIAYYCRDLRYNMAIRNGGQWYFAGNPENYGDDEARRRIKNGWRLND